MQGKAPAKIALRWYLGGAIMCEFLCEKTGCPFTGGDLDRLRAFLAEQGLEYDESITYSVVLEEEGRIAAAGSCHGNVLKCIAVSPEYQGRNLLSVIMTHLIEHMYSQGITHYFGFTKPKNKEVFCNMGLYPVAETGDVLLLENKRNGLKRYLRKLEEETQKAMKVKRENKYGVHTGAVVANCNPFTLGHRYLMEEAAKECRWLHVFILSEEQPFLTSEERFRMVCEGTQNIPNIILHQTSDYLISPAVFPTYFIKEKTKAYEINCMLDLKIFEEYIAKTLGIDRRFVGDEPDCSVTKKYNECMKKVLPEHGIAVTELKRLQINGRTVSASSVRDAFERGELETVADMLPETTENLLRKALE